jgi:hypothetical protein
VSREANAIEAEKNIMKTKESIGRRVQKKGERREWWAQKCGGVFI